MERDDRASGYGKSARRGSTVEGKEGRRGEEEGREGGQGRVGGGCGRSGEVSD